MNNRTNTSILHLNGENSALNTIYHHDRKVLCTEREPCNVTFNLSFCLSSTLKIRHPVCPVLCHQLFKWVNQPVLLYVI